MTVRAVFLDIGETLVDESRLWKLWAEWLLVPPTVFFAALGAVIERGEHHRQVFNVVRPDLAPFDVDRARQARALAGWPEDLFSAEDFYPDAVPCLVSLRTRGYWVGLAGNQPARAETILRDLGVPADLIASSHKLGVEKPSPAFFSRLAEAAGVLPSEIAHVGDRLDNDVLPAADAGMVSIFLERGPWGVIHARRSEVARAQIRIRSLEELPRALDEVGPRQPARARNKAT